MDHSDLERDQLQNLPAGFHAHTWCDSTSSLVGNLAGMFSSTAAADCGPSSSLLKSPRKDDLPEPDAELFMCKIQSAEVRHCQYGQVSRDSQSA